MEYVTTATPRETTKDGVPVFCAYDEIVSVSQLKPNPQNPNQHSKDQLERLAGIIQSTGWRAPITVSTRSGLITKGHGRRQAAIMARLKYAPVEYQEYASEEEEHADLLADNRIAELAEIDDQKLIEMLSAMDGVPIDLTGYNAKELAKMLDAGEETKDDKADVVKKTERAPFSKLGDLWRLGSHRLLCGSATNEEDAERVMDGQIAQCVHTDPPYGVSYETQSGKFGMIKNDDKTHDELMGELLIPALKNYVKHTAADAAFYIWHASSTRRDFEDAMTAAGLMEKQYIIWSKTAPVLGHADYQWSHEPCFYAEKAGEHAAFYGDRSQRTVWKATLRGDGEMAASLAGGIVLTDGDGNKLFMTDKPPKGKKLRYVRLQQDTQMYLHGDSQETDVWEIARETKTVHPTQKPVEIPTRAILNSTKPLDVVVDFFGGSGSTLIAAERTGRICCTIEMDPQYVDAIVRRFFDETHGQEEIILERDGKEYSLQDIKDKLIDEEAQAGDP